MLHLLYLRYNMILTSFMGTSGVYSFHRIRLILNKQKNVIKFSEKKND